MTLVITINSSMAASHSGIKNAVDEFTYSMTVDGAALDPEASQKAIENFKIALLDLESQGITKEEIIATALTQVTDEKTAAELKSALTHIQLSKMTTEEANAFLKVTVEKSYQQGASWNAFLGALQLFGVMILMVSFMMSLLYVVTRSSDCPTNYNEEQCKQWDENVKW